MEITGTTIAVGVATFFTPLIVIIVFTAFGNFMYWLGERSVPVSRPGGQHCPRCGHLIKAEQKI